MRMLGGVLMQIPGIASPAPAAPSATAPALPERVLGGTGRTLGALGLDARPLARLHTPDAVAVLRAGLGRGIELVLTGSPGCERHVAAALRLTPVPVFLAASTVERSCERALRGLDATLARLEREQLDLWQLADIQRMEQLDAISGRRGALEALVRAREDARVRCIGLGGDSDPALLLEAMRRFDFDTLALPLRPGERRFRECRDVVLPEARRRGMGVLALPGGSSVAGLACARYALSYLLSLPIDLVVLPCVTPADVELQVHAVTEARAFSRAELARIDALLAGDG